jgi:hypothetical protein
VRGPEGASGVDVRRADPMGRPYVGVTDRRDGRTLGSQPRGQGFESPTHHCGAVVKAHLNHRGGREAHLTCRRTAESTSQWHPVG